MVILVTGCQGQLGQAIQLVAQDWVGFEFIFTNSQTLNITDKSAIETFFIKYSPDFCINAAAYTAVDLAESLQDKAFEVNEKAVANLAEVCLGHKTVLLHISTDFVFDGSKKSPYLETDETNPLGIYGASKLAGEQAIQKILEKFYIVRTSWVFSGFGKNFLNTMIRLSDQKSEISVVDDQTGCPTHAIELAKTLLVIIEKTSNKEVENAFGVYHFSNKGITTWFGFAQKIMEVYKKDCIVNPIPTTSYPTPAKRPIYSVMDTTKIEQTFQIQIQNWFDVLVFKK